MDRLVEVILNWRNILEDLYFHATNTKLKCEICDIPGTNFCIYDGVYNNNVYILNGRDPNTQLLLFYFVNFL